MKITHRTIQSSTQASSDRFIEETSQVVDGVNYSLEQDLENDQWYVLEDGQLLEIFDDEDEAWMYYNDICGNYEREGYTL